MGSYLGWKGECGGIGLTPTGDTAKWIMNSLKVLDCSAWKWKLRDA